MSKNDITGDNIKSKVTTPEFEKGWELAFGKKEEPKVEQPRKEKKKLNFKESTDD